MDNSYYNAPGQDTQGDDYENLNLSNQISRRYDDQRAVHHYSPTPKDYNSTPSREDVKATEKANEEEKRRQDKEIKEARKAEKKERKEQRKAMKDLEKERKKQEKEVRKRQRRAEGSSRREDDAAPLPAEQQTFLGQGDQGAYGGDGWLPRTPWEQQSPFGGYQSTQGGQQQQEEGYWGHQPYGRPGGG